MRSLRFLAVLAILPGSILATAQTTPPAQGGATTPAQQPTAQQPKSDYKAYDQVITKEAVSQDGVFKVHRLEDKVFWEIPAEMLGREFLWQSEISEFSEGVGAYQGMTANTNVISFSRRGKKVLMRLIRHGNRATDPGIATGVDQMSHDPILFQYDVQTESANKSAVIEVTSLFTSDAEPFAVRGALGSPGPDSSKTWVDRVKAFPTNIETRTNYTFMPGRGGGGSPFAQATSSGPIAATIHYSLLLLPATPMMGRFKDSRIGFFTNGFTQFGSNKPVKDKEFINRFRLEKKDPSAAISEPIKPITFYLGREVPDRWRPALRRGVLAWNAAYERAGFRNAVVCLDAPTKEQDPNWDAEDARYSVIRWAPSKAANAMGPSVQDPRSGETLNAHIIFWHNIVDLVQKWYVVQCGAIDPRCRMNPLPSDLMDDLIGYVCTHEVGHTLGLEHNFRASSAYTVAQLRDPMFCRDHGVSASIMSYSRNNYVAQPGDGITYSTNGKLGPYDFFAIEYGYRPLPTASSPDAEIPWLDRFLARQVTDRTVRFGNYKYNVDPTTMSENISDDPVEATRLGLMNLDRVGRNLALPTFTKFGEDYEDLKDFYGELQMHRLMWLMHTIKLIGGVVETDYHAGRGGAVFAPVPREKQRRAAQFLASAGINTPPGLANPEILTRIVPTGYVSQMGAMNSLVFSQMFNEARLSRMFDWEHMKGASNVYTVKELTDTVFTGVWDETRADKVQVTMLRRDLQRSFLRAIETRLAGPSKSKTDFALLGIDALKGWAKVIDKAIPRSTDNLTAAHLKDCRSWIERIVKGKIEPAAASSGSPFDFFGIAIGREDSCFSHGAALRDLLEGGK